MMNLDMRNMQDHYPHRGDQVEAWIKDRRDQHEPKQPGTEHLIGAAYDALDNLLDEYRLAADTGQSLENIVNGEDDEPRVYRAKKPKKTR
jgi:hypothetical protein